MCRGNRFLRLSIISVISLQNISQYAEGNEHLLCLETLISESKQAIISFVDSLTLGCVPSLQQSS
jgi:hypothetical protein